VPVLQDSEVIATALAAPFDLRFVHFKPGMVQGGRALALAYVDARAVQDRLDQVLGVAGWQDEYDLLANGNVLCRLKVLLGDEWVIKSDVGGPSEQPDDSDRCKAAFSNAFKRAAVKFGVARYLYRLPPQWLDYDSRTKQFLSSPQLPLWALPQMPVVKPPRQPPPHTAPGQENEHVDEQQRRHLLRLLLAKGYSARKLTERYGVRNLCELTVAQYKHAAGSLTKLPDLVLTP
jgi:hypothetical protein